MSISVDNIKISDIALALGGTQPHSLSEYYFGTSVLAGVPSSGAISFSHFRGKKKFKNNLLTPVFADNITSSSTKITTNSPFGTKIAITPDGTRIFVLNNVRRYDYFGTEVFPRIYVFQRAGGTITQTHSFSTNLTNSNPDIKIACSSDGNTFALGSNSEYSVRLYTFNGTSWSQKQVISSNAQGTVFGIAIALSSDGNTLAVGDLGATVMGFNSGGVYVYFRSSPTGTWALQASKYASDGAAAHQFGARVSLSENGNTMAVGAKNWNSQQGAIYIYTRSSGVWTERTKVTAGRGLSGNGMSMSENGVLCAIGSETVNYVYVWTGSGASWTQIGRLRSSAAAAGFGGALAALHISSDGNYIIVSATEGGYGEAYVYIQSNNTWLEQARLIAPNTTGWYGIDVAIQNGIATVGNINVPDPNDTRFTYGRIYVY